jgi:hypothetical protein
MAAATSAGAAAYNAAFLHRTAGIDLLVAADRTVIFDLPF